MAAELDHVLLTNVGAGESADAPDVPLERVWYLLGFFLDACIPSVKAQNVDATWLVWFGSHNDPDLVAEVEALAQNTFVPVWGEPFEPAAVAEVVRRHTSAPWVATTLLACDDAVARECLATVSALKDGSRPVAVAFPHGFTIDRTGGVFRTEEPIGPVRSLIARRPTDGPPTTVLDEVPDPREERVTRPMWIDVDHEPAEADPARGPRVDPADVDALFAVDLEFDRSLTGDRLRAARRQDLRRAGRQLLRDPKLGPLAGRAVRSVRSLGWMRDAAVNVVADRVNRRAGTAGLTHVAGDVDAVLGGERVALLAEYATTPELRPWALRMAGALAGAGYPTLVLAARDRGRPVDAPAELPPGVAVVSRANARYDFGSWAAALAAWPRLGDTAHVLLTNDSIIGPLTGRPDELATLLRRGEADPADVFAATLGRTGAEHLQSYFLLFRDEVLSRPAVQDFFANLPFSRDRIDLVQRYEHGLTALLRSEGISHAAAWDPASLGFDDGVNPSLCWLELFDAGFPFLKRRLLTHPRFATVRPIILAHVRDRFGVDLA